MYLVVALFYFWRLVSHRSKSSSIVMYNTNKEECEKVVSKSTTKIVVGLLLAEFSSIDVTHLNFQPKQRMILYMLLKWGNTFQWRGK